MAIQLASIVDVWRTRSFQEVQLFQYITLFASLTSYVSTQWTWWNTQNYKKSSRVRVMLPRAIAIPSRLLVIALSHWSLLLVYAAVFGVVRYCITPRCVGSHRTWGFSVHTRVYTILHTVPDAMMLTSHAAGLTIAIFNVTAAAAVAAAAGLQGLNGEG